MGRFLRVSCRRIKSNRTSTHRLDLVQAPEEGEERRDTVRVERDLHEASADEERDEAIHARDLVNELRVSAPSPMLLARLTPNNKIISQPACQSQM